MQTADVVIIGGGIVGSSIAYYLTDAGCRNVLVIERESAQGKGSTGKSMGGVRAQFSTPVNITMSLYSIPFYAGFDERLGYPCDYRPQGYLFCATSDKHMGWRGDLVEKHCRDRDCARSARSLRRRDDAWVGGDSQGCELRGRLGGGRCQLSGREIAGGTSSSDAGAKRAP